MKKIILFLLIFINFSTSFAWKLMTHPEDNDTFLTVVWLDEDSKKMEAIAIISVDENLGYMLSVDFGEELAIYSNGTTPFAIKVDGNLIEDYKGVVSERSVILNGDSVYIKMSKKLIEAISKGQTISFISQNPLGDMIVREKRTPENFLYKLKQLTPKKLNYSF